MDESSPLNGRFLLALVAAAFLGGAVALLGARLLDTADDPDPTVALAELRAEMLRTDVTAAAETQALRERSEALEGALQDLADATSNAAHAEALERLQSAVRDELTRIDGRLSLIHAQLAEMVAGAVTASHAGPDRQNGPLDEEQRTFWAARSRGEDAGERFSALVVLGQERSDVGVEVCRERLEESNESPVVIWQALRNLGHFREKALASLVARHLEHEEPVVRSAALEALLEMGAPESDFDPVGAPDDRAEALRPLRDWAAEQR